MKMLMDNMLHKAIVKKTSKKLHIKCMEELSELANCLSTKIMDKNNLAEEICDVYISLYRLRIFINSSKRVHIPNKNFSIKECIYHITNMQIYISKGYLYNEYREVYYETMGYVYGILDHLINKYNISNDVEKWLIEKEQRDRYLLDHNKFTNTIHIY